MASYQRQGYDDQGRKIDEYGNVVRETDEYGNPVQAASVTYVATTGTVGDTNKQHDNTNVYGVGTGKPGERNLDTDRQHGFTGDTGRQHNPSGGYGQDTGRHRNISGDTGTHHNPTGVHDSGRQHGGRQHGTTGGQLETSGGNNPGFGGPFVGTNTADTGTGPRSGTIGGAGYGSGGGDDYGSGGGTGTGYGSGTGYGINTGGTHADAGYGKEYRQYEQPHDQDKKGIMEKIKEKLPGGHSDNK